MKTLNCADCGIEFCLPDDYIKRRKQDGKSFYCPAGHANVYRPSENDKLKEKIVDLTTQIEATEKSRDYWRDMCSRLRKDLEDRERSINGYKGYIGLLKSKHQKQLNS